MQVLAGLYSTGKVESLWENVRFLILERLTKQVLKKRTNLANQKLREWIDALEPELALNDLQEHCLNRIVNLKELQELERVQRKFNSPEEIIDNFAYTSSYFNRVGEVEGETTAPKTLEAVRQAIWNPQSWLH